MAQRKINLITAGTGENGNYTTDEEATYNIADGDAVFYIAYSKRPISLHSILENLTGTLNGTLNIYAGAISDFTKAVQVASFSISSTNDNHVLEKDNWNHAYIFIELKTVGITGGTLKNLITIK